MKIQDLLTKSYVLLDVAAKNKRELVGSSARFLASSHNLSNAEFVVQRSLEREATVSTGIGLGIAIPHCRIDGLDRTCMIAARTTNAVNYGAIDDLPVRLVFMLVSPTNTAAEHAHILSTLSRIVSSEAVRQLLLDAETQEQFLDVIVDTENALAPLEPEAQ